QNLRTTSVTSVTRSVPVCNSTCSVSMPPLSARPDLLDPVLARHRVEIGLGYRTQMQHVAVGTADPAVLLQFEHVEPLGREPEFDVDREPPARVGLVANAVGDLRR